MGASPHVVHAVIHTYHRLFLECIAGGVSTLKHAHSIRQIANDHVICLIVSPAGYRIHTVPVALFGGLLAEGSVSGEAALEEIGELGKQVLPAGDDQINTGTLSSLLRCVLEQGNAQHRRWKMCRQNKLLDLLNVLREGLIVYRVVFHATG